MNVKNLFKNIKALNWKQGLFRLWVVFSVPSFLIGLILFVLSPSDRDNAIGLMLLPIAAVLYFAIGGIFFYAGIWVLSGFGLCRSPKLPDVKATYTNIKDVSVKVSVCIAPFIIRMTAFILSAAFLWFGIVFIDTLAIPFALDYPEGYGGQVSFPAVLIGAYSVVMLFRKIVLKKNVRELLIALAFYIFCNAVAITLVAVGQPSLAPAFGWGGILGIGLYFLIIKPFKKGMIEDNT